MEQNSDRMGFALIALVVVAFVLAAMNTFLKPTVDGFFTGFKTWMTNTFKTIPGAPGSPGVPGGVIDGLRAVIGK